MRKMVVVPSVRSLSIACNAGDAQASRRGRAVVLAATIGITGLFVSTAHAQLTGELGAHDPSTVIKEGSTYYYFATGQGISARTSTDRVNWIGAASVFSAPPAWTTTAVTGYTGLAWAPDIAYFNGKYHLYYSASSWGTIDSAIGVATTTTLASASWTDLGKVIQSDAVGYTQPTTDTTAYNAIDPSIMVDSATNKVWMSWGSYSSGIVVSEIDPSTGKKLGSSIGTKVANNAAGGGWGSSIEGSALVKKGSYYYLFVNYGGCCAGVDSTYNIRVGRSTSPTGPFVDKNGVDMRNGGGSMFLDDDGRMIGPGHFSFYTEGGQDSFGYHYYNGDTNGAPTYGSHNLFWTADAWPSYAVAAPDFGGATSGGWSAAANWSGGIIPNGTGHVANFDTNAAGRYGVSLDGSGRTLGVVNFRSAAGYTVGVVGGPTLTLDADPGYSATVNVSAGDHTIAAPINSIDNLGVNVTPIDSTLVFSSSVTAPQFTKYGHGTLRLAGASTFSGPVLARWGTLDITGSVAAGGYTSLGFFLNESATMTVRGTGSYVANSDFNVGDTGDAVTAATGTLNIADTAGLTVNAAGGLFVGSGYFANTKAVGTVNQSGGTVTANGNFDGAFIIGGRGSAAAVGTYNLSGGTVNANTNLRVGGYGKGTINQTSGTFNVNGYGSVGRFAGATGIWDISGGTLNQPTTGRTLIIGESGNGTLTVRGTGAIVTKGALRIGSNTGSAGVVNLNGGTATVPSVSRGSGSATLNFNGGVLRPTAASTTFLQGLSAANVQAGGAKVDANGVAVTIAQALLRDATLGAAPDGGFVKSGVGTVSLTGVNTYTGTTTVAGGTLKVKYATGSSAATPVLAGGGANIQNGKLVVDYTGSATPAVTIRSLLTAAYGSNFAAGQLRSSTATANRGLGYADDAAGSITVMATLFGDTDLDGSVTITDFNALATNFGAAGGQVWTKGDFDYDGAVGITDFNLLAVNFGQSLAAGDTAAGLSSAAVNTLATTLWDFAVARDDEKAFIAATGVPEPTTLGLLAAAALIGRLRRRVGR